MSFISPQLNKEQNSNLDLDILVSFRGIWLPNTKGLAWKDMDRDRVEQKMEEEERKGLIFI